MMIHKPKGQTLLITVLVLTIALTVVLSLIRRTTTDVATTSQLEESARAFSAAEAGIEDVLNRASGTSVTIQSGEGSATFDTTYTSLSGSTAAYTYPTETQKGDVATVWLVPHNTDNSLDESGETFYCKESGECTIDVCWEQPLSSPDIPAVEIAVLYKHIPSGTYDIQRFAYDPDPARLGNSFTRSGALSPGCGKASGVYTAPTPIVLYTLYSMPIALRMTPYYNGTTFTVAPTAGRTLSSQGFEVSSTGKTGSGVTRKIIVKKNYEAPGSLFDYVLYANTTITNVAY